MLLQAAIAEHWMAPSTIKMEKSPEQNSCSSLSPSSNYHHTTFSQCRSLKVWKPYGRVYPHGFPVSRPRQVSRSGIPSDNIENTSKIYAYEKDRSYFEQCFEELRVLGRGLFGEALEVECRETGKHYAVKRALHTFMSAGNRQQKLREVINHEAIPPHENIVRFEKAWEERGRLYIQTELCGPNLAEYRHQFGVLREHELWKILQDMVKALHHMHSSGMLHMDVKPSNIFIFENFTCKLGDFGLAFDMNEESLDTAEEGDKYYMAPEVLNHLPTTAADIYSLGISMMELATTIDVHKHCDKIRSGELDDSFCIAGQQNELHELIFSLVHPDPGNRPTTGQLMSDARLLANNQKPIFFRELRRDRKMKLQTGPLDKDWDFEFEDEIHPPSLRFSRRRIPLRDTHNDDIWDKTESVRSCLRFEDSSDDDLLSSNSEKLFRRRISMGRKGTVGVPVKKLDFSRPFDMSACPSSKRKRESFSNHGPC